MIVTLLVIAFVIISLALGFIFKAVSKKYSWSERDKLENTSFACFLTGGLVGGLSLAICAGLLIAAQSSISVKQKQIAYEQQVAELNSTYNLLTTNVNNESYKISIQQYNQEVREFKTDIESNQWVLNHNPWVNWFVNRAYAQMDINAVSYIE